MPYLVAAVVVIGVLCLLNLLLMYGVIRRLREHTESLAQRPARTPDIIAGAGSVVGAFTATTVDGDELAAEDLLPGTLVGFFSPGCGACVELLPKFVDYAATHPGGQDRVLAVVVGPEAETGDQMMALSPKARVVVASFDAEIVKAFEVQGYPGFALVGDARVVTVSGGLTAVAAAVKAIA
jgi:thiol-disulfide isomerase/thioredoxin